ncbi:hypothetical protein J5Y09_11855 [Roseomonas sp. PWR1]|uniref:Uncharacterized protein n=1 Tax=Roseomonas nitratireducens TaxID=2820810 RepID=A0ABS4ATA5_9PROT|nr:hypothetical protein [Neoroseomonas nitratireducens]MBP0464603.1 hypothetical protein [Neoroseomonas nitratireducens]
MTMRYTAVRSALLASAILGTPALAQDRVAIFTGGGEGAEIVYVAPRDPRARSAFAAAPEAKGPLVAIVTATGDGLEVTYVAADAAYPPGTFAMVPLSMGTGAAWLPPRVPTGPWVNGD